MVSSTVCEAGLLVLGIVLSLGRPPITHPARFRNGVPRVVIAVATAEAGAVQLGELSSLSSHPAGRHRRRYGGGGGGSIRDCSSGRCYCPANAGTGGSAEFVRSFVLSFVPLLSTSHCASSTVSARLLYRLRALLEIRNLLHYQGVERS